jgi:hypothetical protein
MQEQVKGILFDFKNGGWSVQKLEKGLGFSNGSLGKAASGKVNLSEVRFIKLIDLHQKTFKKTPAVTEKLKTQIKENNTSPKKEAILEQRNPEKTDEPTSLSDLFKGRNGATSNYVNPKRLK